MNNNYSGTNRPVANISIGRRDEQSKSESRFTLIDLMYLFFLPETRSVNIDSTSSDIIKDQSDSDALINAWKYDVPALRVFDYMIAFYLPVLVKRNLKGDYKDTPVSEFFQPFLEEDDISDSGLSSLASSRKPHLTVAGANLRMRLQSITSEGSILIDIGYGNYDDEGRYKKVKRQRGHLEISQKELAEYTYDAFQSEKGFFLNYYTSLLSRLFDKEITVYGLNADGGPLFNEISSLITAKLRELGYYKYYVGTPIERLAFNLYTLTAYACSCLTGRPADDLFLPEAELPIPMIDHTGSNRNSIEEYTVICESFPVNTIERYSYLQYLWKSENNPYAGAELVSMYFYGAVLHNISGVKTYTVKADKDKAASVISILKENGHEGIIRNIDRFISTRNLNDITSKDYKKKLPLLLAKYASDTDVKRLKKNIHELNSIKSVLKDVSNSHERFDPLVYELLRDLYDSDLKDTLITETKCDAAAKWYFSDLGDLNVQGTSHVSSRVPGILDIIYTLHTKYDLDISTVPMWLSRERQEELKQEARNAYIEENEKQLDRPDEFSQTDCEIYLSIFRMLQDLHKKE